MNFDFRMTWVQISAWTLLAVWYQTSNLMSPSLTWHKMPITVQMLWHRLCWIIRTKEHTLGKWSHTQTSSLLVLISVLIALIPQARTVVGWEQEGIQLTGKIFFWRRSFSDATDILPVSTLDEYARNRSKWAPPWGVKDVTPLPVLSLGT